ncbi:MAG: hypothetical protein EXX96DRAFT_589615 [Benjaminiella poitrasii]|nr:MAG: hypothetical protein EXX96DRAFT_589615 [Benjaminiella poitrasii]
MKCYIAASLVLALPLLFTGVLASSEDNNVPVPTQQSSNSRQYVPDIRDVLTENLREAKNIMFSSNLGGSSHVNWVLLILDELYQRGHNITFVTTNLHEKFVKPYPHFNTIVLGTGRKSVEELLKGKHGKDIDSVGKVIELLNENFENDYAAYKDIMVNRSMDIAVCDFGGAVGCSEAAVDTKTPYVVSIAYAITSDASAPYINNNAIFMREATTINSTFAERFTDRIILPIQVISKHMASMRKILKRYQEAGSSAKGLEFSRGSHANALKIVNSMFGIEPARPTGPLVEFVGPILPSKHEPLTAELADFLGTHQRVIYIALGQHASATTDDLKMILTAVMESLEAGAYDGLLWAARRLDEGFPEFVQTQSGKTYKVTDLFNGMHADARFVQWAPQTAILVHPSVSVFLTHGGAGSLYEGLYGGKRLIVFPFFGDQYPHAKNVQHQEMGGFLDPHGTQEEANELLQRIGRDVDGVYQKNVNRYKALVQIHSKHGVDRAADLVEEVLFVNKDGALPYRIEVSREMSFIKANNLDIYVVAVLAVLVPVGLFIWIVKRMLMFIVYKMKTLLRGEKQKTN